MIIVLFIYYLVRIAVVDEQDVLRRNQRRIGDRKCAAHVEPALTRREAGLGIGGAEPHERAGGQSEAPLRMAVVQELERFDGERARLIESALSVLGTMQRHRNDEHFGGSLTGELRDALGQHASKAFSSGMQAIVFESVDGLAHAALVKAIGDGADEGRRGQAASAAKH